MRLILLLIGFALMEGVFASEAKRQFNIILNLEQQVDRLKEQMKAEEAKGTVQLLDTFGKTLKESAQVNPRRGRWRGDFIKASDSRKLVESVWNELKVKLKGYHGDASYKAFAANVQLYIEHRKAARYDQASGLLSSRSYKNSLSEFKGFLEQGRPGSRLLSQRQVSDFSLSMDELLSQLRVTAGLSSKENIPPDFKSLAAKAVKPEGNSEEKNAPHSGIIWQDFLAFWPLIAGLWAFWLFMRIYRAKGSQSSASPTEGKAVTKGENHQFSGEPQGLLAGSEERSGEERSPVGQCIKAFTDAELQTELVEALSSLESNLEDYSSAKNIVLGRVNTIVSSLSKLEDPSNLELKNLLKEEFVAIQKITKAMRDNSSSSAADKAMVEAFRILLAKLVYLGRNQEQLAS